MGALHEGHLSLMRTARNQCDTVVASIFVNPTQFGQGEDFDKYPRTLESDCALAESAGVDIVFAPEVSAMYPRISTTIKVGEIASRWEGAFRPGHFDGVATIVTKLFNIVQPDAAYFGLKDLQQCLVLKGVVEDLNIPVDLHFEETVRESDGLALSSRNVYLSEQDREIAPELYRLLRHLKQCILAGDGDIDHELSQARLTLSNKGFAIDYLEMVDLDAMSIARNVENGAAVIVAAKIGVTRLIDNVRIFKDAPK
jgi:pantoate--beta-alanine ligase